MVRELFECPQCKEHVTMSLDDGIKWLAGHALRFHPEESKDVVLAHEASVTATGNLATAVFKLMNPAIVNAPRFLREFLNEHNRLQARAEAEAREASSTQD